MSQINQWFFEKGSSAIVIVKDGSIHSMIKFPDDMDKEDWELIVKGVDHRLMVEEQLEQHHKEKQIRVGFDLMEKLHD